MSKKQNNQPQNFYSETQLKKMRTHWADIKKKNKLNDNQPLSSPLIILWILKLESKGEAQAQKKACSDSLQTYSTIHNLPNKQFNFQQALQFFKWHHSNSATQNNKTDNKLMEKKSPKSRSPSYHKQQKQQQVDHEVESNPYDSQEEQDDNNQFGMESTVLKKMRQQQSKKEVIQKSYKQYLRLVFDHYCRIIYSNGNDPTFEQIQQRTNVLTINKFMIFCKEFGIVKLNSLSRSYLLELFKKNAQSYKEMNFERFINLLIKISYRVYSQEKEIQQVQQSKEFQQLLLFLQVNNFKVFRQKMQKLNIAYRPIKTSHHIDKEKLLKNYQFKYNNEGQKSPDTNNPRPKITKANLKKLAKSHSTKNQINIRKEEGNTKITNHVRSKTQDKLAPLKPSVRRQSLSIPRSPSRNEESEVVGYTNIYKIKKQKQNGPILRLNNIVEDAKKMVAKNSINQYLLENKLRTQDRVTPVSDYYSLAQSRADSSRKSLIYGEVSKPYRRNQNLEESHNPPLQQLVDEQDDEYLNQHLSRQNNEQISQRIEARIKAISKK